MCTCISHLCSLRGPRSRNIPALRSETILHHRKPWLLGAVVEYRAGAGEDKVSLESPVLRKTEGL